MRALLVTHGTRGDVQPFLALAVALRQAGHDAVLAAPESFADSAAAHDVEFAPLDEGPNRLLIWALAGLLVIAAALAGVYFGVIRRGQAERAPSDAQTRASNSSTT